MWAIDVASDESGISRPSDGVYKRNALRATYDAFGSERYVLAFDDRRLREVAAAAPYDFIEIVANDRKYGGGGIHNLYATVSADNAFTPYVFVHEFAHHFGGLADEYYTSSTAYEAGAGPAGAVGAERDRGPEGGALEGPDHAGHAAADALAEGGVREGAGGLPGQARRRSAPTSGRSRRWRRCSARSSGGPPRSSRRTTTRWAPSRARCTKRRATTGRRPTASCSPATTSASAPSAAATWSASSTRTRNLTMMMRAAFVPLVPAPRRRPAAAEIPRAVVVLESPVAPLPGQVAEAAPPRFVLLEDGQVFVGGTHGLATAKLSSAEHEGPRPPPHRPAQEPRRSRAWSRSDPGRRCGALILRKGRPLEAKIEGDPAAAPPGAEAAGRHGARAGDLPPPGLRPYTPAFFALVRAGGQRCPAAAASGSSSSPSTDASSRRAWSPRPTIRPGRRGPRRPRSARATSGTS